MKMSCYVVDDHAHVIDRLVYLIRDAGNLELIGADTNPLVALNKLISGAVQPDIIFLDIDMPGMDGLELSRQLSGKMIVIFVTGHTEHALEAFNIGAIDYLLKPVSAAEFMRAIERAEKQIITRPEVSADPGFIFVRLDSSSLARIDLCDLAWLRADNKYAHLQMTSNRTVMISKPLSNIEAVLPADRFARIHKSHIVNLDYVEKVLGNRVMMKDGNLLEIGRTYMQPFYTRLNPI